MGKTLLQTIKGSSPLLKWGDILHKANRSEVDRISLDNKNLSILQVEFISISSEARFRTTLVHLPLNYGVFGFAAYTMFIRKQWSRSSWTQIRGGRHPQKPDQVLFSCVRFGQQALSTLSVSTMTTHTKIQPCIAALQPFADWFFPLESLAITTLVATTGNLSLAPHSTNRDHMCKVAPRRFSLLQTLSSWNTRTVSYSQLYFQFK